MRQFTARLSRAGLIATAAVCVVAAAGGLAAATFTGAGRGGGAGTAESGTTRDAAAGMPQVVASPEAAAMPKTTAGPARTRPATPTTTCAHPSFVTSAQFGMWNLAPYFVGNDMWNSGGYQVTQTLYACSYSNWYVVATMNNDSGNAAVKTYPDAQKDFSEPRISSLKSVTSTFAETSPGTGIYEDAYDIWLNGIASSGSTEVMIWTENHHQRPGGSIQGTATVDGRSYTVWRKGSYIAFVASSNFTSGTMNLLGFFTWAMAKGWMPANSTLSAVDYGVELVSTNNVPATFRFSDFSVTAS